MLNTLAPPKHAMEILQEIAASQYRLQGKWKPLSGERDQNFRVSDETGSQWVFKFCHPNEPAEIIACQAEALEHIARTDLTLPVPRLRRTLSGKAVGEVVLEGQTCLVMVLSYLPGEPVGKRQLAPQTLRSVGIHAARLSKALRGFVSPAPASRTLVWDTRHVLGLRPYVKLLPVQMRQRTSALLMRFEKEIQPGLELLRCQILHGDLQPYNMLIGKEGSISGIIDFGDMVHASLVQDVANTISDYLWPGTDFEQVFAEIVRGYCSTTALEEAELDLILGMVEIRLVMNVLINAAKSAAGLPVDGYHIDFAGRCQAMLKTIEAKGRNNLTDLIRRAGNFQAKARPKPQSIKALMKRRRAIMGSKPYMFYDPPLHIVRGEGVWLNDDAGRAFLDCYNNVPAVGHCHPYVTEAIVRQARRLNTNTRYLTDESLEYAERLAETLDPSLSSVIFVNSGSEACDIAWRMAKAWTGRRGGLAMEFAYHGITDAIDGFSPSAAPGAWSAPHIRLLPAPDAYRGQWQRGERNLAGKYADLADPLIAELEHAGFGLAATMIDAAFMTNGMLEVPKNYVKSILQKTHAAGGLYIADEVQAGFGRMGTAMWGHQHHGIVPDLVAIGKPAGNGHPLGVVITRPEILDHFTRHGPFFSTFGGNNVSCAAGIAVLDVIRDENLIANAKLTGTYLRDGLRSLMRRHGLIGDVRGTGFAIGFELVSDRVSKQPASDKLKPLLNLLRDEGVLFGNEGKFGNIVKVRPPISFDVSHADIAIAAMDRALARL